LYLTYINVIVDLNKIKGKIMKKLLLSIITLVSISFSSVDINHANEKDLSTLKGIGVSKAKSIVKYRKDNGCFKDVESLIKVKGIGSSIIKKNHKNITISKCKNK